MSKDSWGHIELCKLPPFGEEDRHRLKEFPILTHTELCVKLTLGHPGKEPQDELATSLASVCGELVSQRPVREERNMTGTNNAHHLALHSTSVVD